MQSKNVGGALYLANQAHHPYHPLLKNITFGDKSYLVAEDPIPASSELYWDYKAITDDKEDHLLGVMCACGCNNPLITFKVCNTTMYHILCLMF